jgi:uncharacterized membrane protein
VKLSADYGPWEDNKEGEFRMANLLVITFDNMDEAGNLLGSIKELQKEAQLQINDAAVIVKDEEGKVKVKNQADTGMKAGAVGGGVLGLIIGTVFFPIGGMLLGAAAGAMIGKMAHLGVDNDFVKEVTNQLTPGTSALFIMASKVNPGPLRSALEKYRGKLFQSTLDDEALEEVKKALKDES